MNNDDTPLLKSTFWNVITTLIIVLIALLGGLAGMSVAMDSSIDDDLSVVEQKIPTIDRIDERTVGMQRDIAEIKTLLTK